MNRSCHNDPPYTKANIVLGRVATLIAIAGLLAYATPLYAITCPDQPPLSDKRLEVDLSGKAKALAKLGAGEINAHVKTEEISVLNRYPNADHLIVTMSFLSMFCQALNTDKTLSADQRISRIDSFRRELMH